MNDIELLAAFEEGTLPASLWNHQAHVRVAFLYASASGWGEAMCRMRSGIQAYNKAQGTPEAIDQGYHETITQAFMWLVFAANLQTGPHETSREFYARHPTLLNKGALLGYYSRDRILTWQAKQEFVEPDLQPLPPIRRNAAG